MNESIAVAKEVDAKKSFSSARRNDTNIQLVRDESERQLGSLGGVIGNIRRDGTAASAESIATELGSMHTAQRTPALLALQQTHGNRYVQRVVAGIQAKLTVGKPGDKYEQEADRVADDVMRMPEPEEEEEETLQTKPLAEEITPLVQRQVEPEEEEEEEIQTKQLPSQTHEIVPDVETRINSIRGGGQPLPESARAFFEPRFKHDFSRVRVHTDAKAADTARAVNARAFTRGHDVVFGAGQYAPGTHEGRRLVAHELTHVVQQHGGRKLVQRETKKSPCTIHAYDKSNPKDTAVIPKGGSGIGVSSVDDMVKKVNAHVNDPKNSCSCVSRLEINGHGTDGYQSVGNGDQYVNNGKALVYNSKEAHLKKLASVNFCSTGLFMMLGCHVGRGNGKKLLSRISKILPGKLIGGAQHYTAGTGLGGKKVVGAGDKVKSDGTVDMSKLDPFLTSSYVRWHITIGGKEYIINGTETTSTEGKAKLKAADKIKVKTPEGTVKIK